MAGKLGRKYESGGRACEFDHVTRERRNGAGVASVGKNSPETGLSFSVPSSLGTVTKRIGALSAQFWRSTQAFSADFSPREEN